MPIYDTLGVDSVEYILQQTCLKTCICGVSETKKLLDLKRRLPCLEYIILIGEITDQIKSMADDCNVTLLSFETVLSEGKKDPVKSRPPFAEDICTICYTSGTTGSPKGVLISHRNFVSAIMATIQTGLYPTSKDRYLSYLPLAHVLERAVSYALLSVGAQIGFAQGDRKRIVSDLKALRPTVFCSVPQLLNRMYDGVKSEIEKRGRMVRSLFHWGMEMKKYRIEHGYNKSDWLFDTFLFGPIRKSIGLENVRIAISGSAPLSDEVKSFLQCLLNGVIVEGYGATETSGPATIELAGSRGKGTVGVPIPCCLLKLIDVPEMGYCATDRVFQGKACLGCGELCIKGYNVSSGYYKNDEASKASFDEEGFFRTGDIAVLLPNYEVKIIDRKKNIFKLSQGEYIAVEKLEAFYGSSPFVKQIFIYGDSLRNYLIGFVVPEESFVMEWAQSVPSYKGFSFRDICRSQLFHRQLSFEFQRIFEEKQLKGFERVTKFKVEPDAWTVEQDLVTPTFKLRRRKLRDKFQESIKTIYSA